MDWRSVTCIGAVDDQGFDDVNVPVLACNVEGGASTRIPDVHLEVIKAPAP